MKTTCITVRVAGIRALSAAIVLSTSVPSPGAHGDDATAIVRLAAVNAPYQSGLLSTVLLDFEKSSGYKVEVYGGSDVFARARRGEADIVIAHWGKGGARSFVMDGFGSWPHTVFSNQSVLVGPKSDPARIRGMTDPFAAMRKIAQSDSPFVCASNPGARYLCELLLAGAGNPDRGTWYTETMQSKGRAMRVTEDKNAYTIWGSFPFERFKSKHGSSLEVMVWDSPVLHRALATFVANPERFPDANVAGARELEAWLLSPAVQAAVASYREAGVDRQTWWPAARNNDPAQLLGVSGGDESED